LAKTPHLESNKYKPQQIVARHNNAYVGKEATKQERYLQEENKVETIYVKNTRPRTAEGTKHGQKRSSVIPPVNTVSIAGQFKKLTAAEAKLLCD